MPLYLRHSISWLLFLLAFPPQVSEIKTIPAMEAKTRVGETVCVCGVVVGIYEPQRSRRNPMFLNFDQPYPQNLFAAVIWCGQRPAFGDL